MDIGIGSAAVDDDDAALPVVGSAPGVGADFDAVFVDAAGEGDDFGAAEFGIGDGGDVDVEEGAFGEGAGGEELPVFDDPAGTGFEVEGGSVGEDGHGEADAAYSVYGAFHGTGDGSGVGDIKAHVGAVVEARENEVASVGELGGEGDIDAVHGKAVDFEGAESVAGGFFDAEGVAHGHGVPAGAAFSVGATEDDFTELAGGLGEGEDAVGVESVVVGDEDAHGLAVSLARTGGVSGHRRYPRC